LNQYSVDLVPPVKIFHQSQQLSRRRAFRRSVLFAVNADFLTSLDLSAHIYFRCRIVADQNDRQPGSYPSGSHGLSLRRDFGADVVRDFCAVEDSRWHFGSRQKSYTARLAKCSEDRELSGTVLTPVA
jgi:hypothetical protein